MLFRLLPVPLCVMKVFAFGGAGASGASQMGVLQPPQQLPVSLNSTSGFSSQFVLLSYTQGRPSLQGDHAGSVANLATFSLNSAAFQTLRLLIFVKSD